MTRHAAAIISLINLAVSSDAFVSPGGQGPDAFGTLRLTAKRKGSADIV
eukprot:CAMPEP_0113581208 /NCGR_PEP_ID=MMETSP0015_2-20120614/31148_1 /TAXON_ID=2838 /ORGANISM="Odontella" /LENGTH=48 /DNA_ID=CAMNT_0000485577 /DNA_START=70 /DNA_END=213 /DNA_ORIENTATION=+ /assembly_acc=CAM_ASM_000160